MIKQDPHTFIYWTRALSGIIIGALSGLLRLEESEGISLALLVFLISVYVYQYALHIDPNTIKQSKLYTIGMGAYFFSWITIWTLLHTFFLGL